MPSRAPAPPPSDSILSARHPARRSVELWLVVSAIARSPATIRHELREWLTGLHWPQEECADIVLAVDEAISNVVEHAYPPDGPAGDARLYAWEVLDHQFGERRVVTVITDSGRWKPPATDPGFRGRGLAMMAGCMGSLQIESTPAGTTVIMTSVAVEIDNHR